MQNQQDNKQNLNNQNQGQSQKAPIQNPTQGNEEKNFGNLGGKQYQSGQSNLGSEQQSQKSKDSNQQ